MILPLSYIIRQFIISHKLINDEIDVFFRVKNTSNAFVLILKNVIFKALSSYSNDALLIEIFLKKIMKENFFII